jgi:16S rRNA (guanine966-N2)-methyltransferase
MRIISGKSKGKKIFDPKDINTRPLKDLTKESIFNIIIHSNKLKFALKNSNVLDLFSGVGSFGLECLSRGSKNVTFVENYNNVLPTLKKNILNLGYQDSALVVEKNILSQLNFKNFDSKFDIIFMDPPYKEKSLNKIIIDIIDAKIIKDNGIVIIHRHKKEKDEFPKKFQIIEEKIYGISRVLFGNCS